MGKVIFISGIYGTGKTTVGRELARRLGVSCYEASELITAKSGEAYGATKHVSDASRNQDILAEQVDELLKTQEAIILTGHFAIFNKARQVEAIPNGVFGKLRLAVIILLEADTGKAAEHLKGRDGKSYTQVELAALQEAECRFAGEVAKREGIPLYTRQMDYQNDANEIEQYIRSVRRTND
jgi:adenylate kinase